MPNIREWSSETFMTPDEEDFVKYFNDRMKAVQGHAAMVERDPLGAPLHTGPINLLKKDMSLLKKRICRRRHAWKERLAAKRFMTYCASIAREADPKPSVGL